MSVDVTRRACSLAADGCLLGQQADEEMIVRSGTRTKWIADTMHVLKTTSEEHVDPDSLFSDEIPA
jgi:hypothetical protein